MSQDLKNIHIKYSDLMKGWIIYRNTKAELYGSTLYLATNPNTPYWDWDERAAGVYVTKAEAVFVAQNNPYLKGWTLA